LFVILERMEDEPEVVVDKLELVVVVAMTNPESLSSSDLVQIEPRLSLSAE
jgi:hypothetical protein